MVVKRLYSDIKNKHILVATLHFYNNYGSVLQAFALKHILESRYSCEVDFLPFRPPIQEYQYFTEEHLKEKYKGKKEKFDSFRIKMLGLPSKNSDTLNGAFSLLGRKPSDYDAYVAGSDIIWGREFSNLANPYFLDFEDCGDRKRIAYAASVILNANGNTEDNELFQRKLCHFSAIGMREKSAENIISKLSGGVPVQVVLDPTILLDRVDYRDIENDVSEYMGEPYLLSYFLTHDPAVVDYTNMIAQKLGLRVLHYFADYPINVFPNESQCFAFTGPGEFLSLIKNADIVFTNSFHGTCLSMVYRKPFYTYMAKRRMLSRVRDTVSSLGMENRFFMDYCDLTRIKLEIGYDEMETKLWELRQSSFDFLKRSLELCDV